MRNAQTPLIFKGKLYVMYPLLPYTELKKFIFLPTSRAYLHNSPAKMINHVYCEFISFCETHLLSNSHVYSLFHWESAIHPIATLQVKSIKTHINNLLNTRKLWRDGLIYTHEYNHLLEWQCIVSIARWSHADYFKSPLVLIHIVC